MAMAERRSTPFPEVLRALNTAGATDPAGAVTIALLPKVAGVLADPDRYRRLWEPAWRRVLTDITLLETGRARVEEIQGGDLAVVRTPHPLAPLALHPRITAMRVLTATPDGILRIEHRYETWVRYVTAQLPRRVDLTDILPRLARIEPNAGTWRFDGIDHPQARLVFCDRNGAPTRSGLQAEQLAAEVMRVNVPANG
jgi:hypothetical protein